MKLAESLSTLEVAKDLGIGRASVHRMLHDGVLPAIRIGRNWKIPLEPYLKFKSQFLKEQNTCPPSLSKLMEEWLYHLRHGSHPLSPVTVADYRRDFNRYLRIIGGGLTPAEVLNKEKLSKALECLPIASYSNRYNMFYAVNSFTKYLISRDLLPEEVHTSLKPLRPRRYYPPKRLVMDQEQVNRFLAAIWVTTGNTSYERVLNFTITKLLIGTGLRNKELCDLQLSDIDLSKRVLVVTLGKGAKSRSLGLNQEIVKVLSEYLAVRPFSPSSAFFLTEAGRPLRPELVSRRIKRISEQTGIPITPHGLRRVFVSLNALKGKSIAVISRACGHRSLETTNSYLLLSERQIINDMQNW